MDGIGHAKGARVVMGMVSWFPDGPDVGEGPGEDEDEWVRTAREHCHLLLHVL